MANGIFGLKNFLPPSGEGVPAEERIGRLEDFVYQLQEVLDHTLRNLDPKANFNTSQTDSWSSEILGPVFDRVDATAADVRGRIEALRADVAGDIGALGGRVLAVEGQASDLDGRVTTAAGQISGLDVRLSATEGEIASLDGRVSALEGTTGDHTTELSELTDKVDGLNNDFDTRVEAVLTAHGLI
jgi:chromosome segregation ATPase